jgi:hypothetical protein
MFTPENVASETSARPVPFGAGCGALLSAAALVPLWVLCACGGAGADHTCDSSALLLSAASVGNLQGTHAREPSY